MIGWRKHVNWLSKTKGLPRDCGRACRGGGKNTEARIEKIAGAYLTQLYALEEKAQGTLEELRALTLCASERIDLDKVRHYHELLIKHICLISDRLLEGRTIAQGEKLYSIFEQHTEWVKKGKSRPNVELGHRRLIATDQYGLIHDYNIMQGGDEAAEAAPQTDRPIAKLGLNTITSFSVDRGFSSIENRELLELTMPHTKIIMPKKGKLSAADKQRQSQKAWRTLANNRND